MRNICQKPEIAETILHSPSWFCLQERRWQSCPGCFSRDVRTVIIGIPWARSASPPSTSIHLTLLLHHHRWTVRGSNLNLKLLLPAVPLSNKVFRLWTRFSSLLQELSNSEKPQTFPFVLCFHCLESYGLFDLWCFHSSHTLFNDRDTFRETYCQAILPMCKNITECICTKVTTTSLGNLISMELWASNKYMIHC